MELPTELSICGARYVMADLMPGLPRIERYYTIPELSELTGIPKGEINAAIRRGEMTCIYPSGGTRYRRVAESEFRRWLASRMRATSSTGA